MGEITRDEIRERLGNIDQIRDIIFGAHLREYTSRLDKTESDISAIQQDISDRLNDLKLVLASELRAAVDSIDKRLKTISASSQEEAADLRQQFDRINRKFTNSIETLDETVETQRVALRDEIIQTRESLQSDTRELRSLVLEELDRHFSILREDKISKDDMAELLFELGMRLKGSEFVPELRGAVEEKVDEKYEQVNIIGSAKTDRSASEASKPASRTTKKPSI
jgi:HD-GYP domain-containing protein (c-di-GMP phosphodiesterase class II)